MQTNAYGKRIRDSGLYRRIKKACTYKFLNVRGRRYPPLDIGTREAHGRRMETPV